MYRYYLLIQWSQSCSTLFALSNVQPSLSVWFSFIETSTVSVASYRCERAPCASDALTKFPSGRLTSAKLVFLILQKKGDVLYWAYSVERRGEEQTVPVNGVSVLLLARRLPTGGARTKGNVHGVQIQSLVMQKSWDRLSGWQTNGEPS